MVELVGICRLVQVLELEPLDLLEVLVVEQRVLQVRDPLEVLELLAVEQRVLRVREPLEALELLASGDQVLQERELWVVVEHRDLQERELRVVVEHRVLQVLQERAQLLLEELGLEQSLELKRKNRLFITIVPQSCSIEFVTLVETPFLL